MWRTMATGCIDLAGRVGKVRILAYQIVKGTQKRLHIMHQSEVCQVSGKVCTRIQKTKSPNGKVEILLAVSILMA